MGNVYSVVVRKNVDAIIDPDMLFVKEIVTQAFTDLGNFMVGREEGNRIGFTATFAFVFGEDKHISVAVGNDNTDDSSATGWQLLLIPHNEVQGVIKRFGVVGGKGEELCDMIFLSAFVSGTGSSMDIVLDTLEESVKPVLKDRNIELIYKPLVPP